jgi:ATP-binding cassette subfamily F protein uup
VGSLSGGERNRVQLAKLLRAGGNLLVLDEPTNDLDLMTLGVLEDALMSFGGCALVVSHDRWFLDKVATGILAFEGDGKVTFYEGNYQEYLERRPKKADAPLGKEKKAPPPKPVATKKFGYKEQREFSTIEQSIEAAEARVAELQNTLNDPATYRGQSDVPSLVKQLDEARAEVERLYARWQELEALKST